MYLVCQKTSLGRGSVLNKNYIYAVFLKNFWQNNYIHILTQTLRSRKSDLSKFFGHPITAVHTAQIIIIIYNKLSRLLPIGLFILVTSRLIKYLRS